MESERVRGADLRPHRLFVESQWVSKPLAFAGKRRPRRLNNQPLPLTTSIHSAVLMRPAASSARTSSFKISAEVPGRLPTPAAISSCRYLRNHDRYGHISTGGVMREGEASLVRTV
jgi:hypothetical protein